MTGRPDQCTPCAELLEWYRTTPDVDPPPPPGTPPGTLVAGAIAAYHDLGHPADMAPGAPCRYLPCAGRGPGHTHTPDDTGPDDGTPTVGQLLQRGLPPHVLGFRDPAASLAPTPLRHIRTS